MENKQVLRILGIITFIVSMVLLSTVSWKVSIGVLLFGWSMNVENYLKYKHEK